MADSVAWNRYGQAVEDLPAGAQEEVAEELSVEDKMTLITRNLQVGVMRH